MDIKKYVSPSNLQVFLNNLKNIFAFKTDIDEVKEAKADWNQNDQSAIDYVKNRTHYVDKLFEDFSWNGTTNGETFVDTKYKYTYTKLSSQVFTSTDINNAKITLVSNGTDYTPTTSTINQQYDGMYYCNKVFSVNSKYVYVFIISGKAGTYDLCTIPSDGTYVKVHMSYAVNWSEIKFTFAGTIKKLDEVFIPDSIFESIDAKAELEHTHSFEDLDDKPFGYIGSTQLMSWDGRTSGLSGVAIDGTVWYRIGNYLSPETLLGSKATMSNGTVIEFITDNLEIRDDGYAESRYIRLVPTSNYQADVYEYFDIAGLYHIEPSAWGHYTKEISKDIVNTLDEKFIPDSIARTIDLDIAMEEVDSSLSKKANVDHTHSEYLTCEDLGWNLIYDSGEIPAIANSISGINISGYTNFQILVRCYNDGDSYGNRNGSVIFTGTNGKSYQFPVWTDMFSNSICVVSAMAQFKVIDGWLVCTNASKLIGNIDIFDSTEGGTAGNLVPTGSGMKRCTTSLSTLAVSNLDQNTKYYFGSDSRVMVWGWN